MIQVTLSSMKPKGHCGYRLNPTVCRFMGTESESPRFIRQRLRWAKATIECYELRMPWNDAEELRAT